MAGHFSLEYRLETISDRDVKPALLEILFASERLIQRLEMSQRVRVLAALGVILILGALLVLFVRAASRTARWYGRDVQKHPRLTPHTIASQDSLPPSQDRPDC